MVTLVIVESAGKINKIQSILGNNYKVVASYGHIIDLEKKGLSVDVNNNYEPTYSVMKDASGSDVRAKTTIKNLKDAQKKSSDIILASDEDREGEMIAWSLAHVLKLTNPKRIVFNSITKDEILKAVNNPTTINQDLVDAQKARRIIDRLAGYKLSGVLWKQIKSNLTAGRVQSVVVRLIVDKENEIDEFFKDEIPSSFKFTGEFDDLKATLYYSDNKQVSIESVEQAINILKKILMKSTYAIKKIENKTSKKSSSAPFTTSTLQQEASRKFGFSIKQTMSVAQHLYEAGYITYMRTDSMSLSADAMTNIKNYILNKYDESYLSSRQHGSKKGNTQEAHEAVRPTDINKEFITQNQGSKIGEQEVKLYSLIWKRTIASQMSPAIYDVNNIIISISKTEKYVFKSVIKKLTFPGFLVVYGGEADDEENTTTKTYKEGEKLDVKKIEGVQEYAKPPTRYNEATLVNKLDPKNLNIGRPSTYAPIISKIQEQYVKKMNINGVEKSAVTLMWNGKSDKYEESVNTVTIGKETDKMVPTSIGKTVTEFLMTNFPDIMNYTYTADMENKLDEIANNKIIWHRVVDDFYTKFHPLVEQLSVAKKYDNPEVGNYTTGKPIEKLVLKDVPVVRTKIGTKYVYANIEEPFTYDNITEEEAIKLLDKKTEYPKNLGKHDGNEVVLKKGQYGLYISYLDTNISTPKEVNLSEAIELIKTKIIWAFKDKKKIYTLLHGKISDEPYLRVIDTGKKTAKPKNVPITKLYEEEINHVEKINKEEIIKVAEEYYPKRSFKKKTK